MSRISAPVLRAWCTAASVSRIHIVAIAALGTLTFGWLFTGSYPWVVAAICALDWLLVNLLNRVVDIPEDAANAIFGTRFVARHRRAILVSGLSVLAGSLAVGHVFLPALTPWRVGYHLLGAAYNWPLVPGWPRIKQLYFWKNSASAAGFLITGFGYPLAPSLAAAAHRGGFLFPSGIQGTTLALTVLFFVLFEMSYEVIYDLRDREGDARAAVRTYPVVHGERVAVGVVDGLLGGSAATLALGYAAGQLPWRIFVMIAAPLAQLIYYKRAMWRGRRRISSRDCIALTWIGAALLLTYHLWIAAALPGIGR